MLAEGQYPVTIDKAAALAQYWLNDQKLSPLRVATLCARPLALRECGGGYHVDERSNLAFPKHAGTPPQPLVPERLARVVLLMCGAAKLGPQEVLDVLASSGYDNGLAQAVLQVLCPSGRIARVLATVMHPPTTTFVRKQWLEWMLDHGAEAAETALETAMLDTVVADTCGTHAAVVKAKQFAGLAFRLAAASEVPVVECAPGRGVVCSETDHVLLVMLLHNDCNSLVPNVQRCLDQGSSTRALWAAYEQLCL